MGVWIAIVVMAAVVTWRFRPAPPGITSPSKTDDLAPDVRRDLHSDAVRLNRQQLWLALLGLVLVAVAVPLDYFLSHGQPLESSTLWAAGVVLVWIIRTCLEWRRLRQIDPYRYE